MNEGLGPTRAIVQGSAARLAEALSLAAWEGQRSEYGGLLWGRVVPDPDGPVAWVAAVTPAIGSGSAVDFNIAPESFFFGRKLLDLLSFPLDLEELGLWHSHPSYGAWLSNVDVEYFHLVFPRPELLSLVIDPVRQDRAIFAKSPGGARSVPGWTYEGTEFGEIPEIDPTASWNHLVEVGCE